MKLAGPIWLGSASPRRRLLLAQAGIDAKVRPPDLDDGDLTRGRVSPRQWVMALAYFKARRVADELIARFERDGDGPTSRPLEGTVLGADTVCVHDGRILGQPRDADHARSMLMAMRDDVHVTMTGVCLLPLDGDERTLFVDEAEVRVGHVSDEQIADYLDSGDWRGKAGAYNLSERITDGWPIECQGDAATVMGLPMRRLVRLLETTED